MSGNSDISATKTLILVDWSNLLYRAWFVSREESWIAFCKFFDMLRMCVHRSKQEGIPTEIIFAGESRSKLNRSKLCKSYKANRKPPENLEFRAYRQGLAELLEKLGWPLVSYPGAEADDVIASIVKDQCHRCFCKTPCVDCHCADEYTTDVVIFSGDRDLQQLLAWDRTRIYRAPGVFIDKKQFEEEYGIPVTKFTIYKALVGDKSDNITGVNGFGPVKAVTSIIHNTVPEDVYEMGGQKAVEDFEQALELVKLDYNCPVDLSRIHSGEPDLSQVSDIDDRILLELKRLREEFR